MVPENEYSALELMQARVAFVPEQWSFDLIGKVLEIRNNLRKPINEGERGINPGPFPYYGPTKIQGYIGSYEQDGSYVLIGEDGDHFLKYRDQPMTQLVDGKCTVNNHAHIIAESKTVTREWFYYYFMHRDIFSFLSRQGAGRFKLNKASLERIPLLTPPLPEQRKIAKILQTWDRAIATTEKLIDASKQQKKALMQQLLTGKKRFAGETIAPEEWEKKNISDIAKVKSGSTPLRTKQDLYYSNDGTPWIKTLDLNNSDIYTTDEKITDLAIAETSCSVFPQDTVLVAMYGGFNQIGRTGLIKVPSSINQALSGLIIDVKFALPKYIQHYLNLNIGLWKKFAASSRKDPNITRSDVCSFPVLLPPLYEQIRIVNLLSNSDHEIDQLKIKLSNLRQEKKALMQQLLTGKRRVKVDD